MRLSTLIKKGDVSMNQQALERRDALLKAGIDKDEAKSCQDDQGYQHAH